nr:hypothetical protein [Tanacetum cinerariifolium]
MVVIVQEECTYVVTYSDPSVAQEQNNQDVVLEHESDDITHDDPNEHNDEEDVDVKEDVYNEEDEVDDNAKLEEDGAHDIYDKDEDDE